MEKEWSGKTKEELLAKRNAPAEINKLNLILKGKSVYIYMQTDFTADIPPNEYYEAFYVDSGGIIYRIKTYSK